MQTRQIIYRAFFLYIYFNSLGIDPCSFFYGLYINLQRVGGYGLGMGQLSVGLGNYILYCLSMFKVVHSLFSNCALDEAGVTRHSVCMNYELCYNFNAIKCKG